MLIAVCSLKGAPGVTRLAMSLAALWPGETTPVLMEADAAGGTIAARFDLAPAQSSLTSLAAASFLEPDVAQLGAHARKLPGGLPVLPAPVDPAGVRAAVSDLAAPGGLLEIVSAEPEKVVVADCGRLDACEPSPLLPVATQVLLVVRPLPETIGPLDAALKVLHGCHVGLVLRGDGYEAQDIARALNTEVAARLPEVPERGMFAKSRQAAYTRAVQQLALTLAHRNAITTPRAAV